MQRLLRIAACSLALTACDGTKDSEGQSAPTGSPDAAAAADAAATGEAKAPTVAAPATGSPSEATPPAGGASQAPLYPGDMGYDCGKLLLRPEIVEACGVEVDQVIIDKAEGRNAHTQCSRRWRFADKGRTVSLVVGNYESPDKAQALSHPEDAKAFSEIGDSAWAYFENRAPQIDWHTFRATKGPWVIDLRSIVTDGKEPLCNLEQLSKLSKEAVARLEQAPPAP